MNISVRAKNGDVIQVNDKNIIGLDDSIDFLNSKRKLVSAEYQHVLQEINNENKRISLMNDQKQLFKSQDLVEIFDSSIAALPIQRNIIEAKIKKVNKKISHSA